MFLLVLHGTVKLTGLYSVFVSIARYCKADWTE